MLDGLLRWASHVRLLLNRRKADPFGPVWDQPSKDAQLELLRKVLEVSEQCDIRLFIFWGTLLGHVRENGMLPWDDDVDVAFFDPGDTYMGLLVDALHRAGLRTHEHFSDGCRTLKVYGPEGIQTGYIWNWPYVDIFPYSAVAPRHESPDGVWPVPRNLILPGRPIRFEGLYCWEPESPLALLDRQYPDWRTCERSATWDHKNEREIQRVVSRPILTDANGRRMSGSGGRPINPLRQGRSKED